MSKKPVTKLFAVVALATAPLGAAASPGRAEMPAHELEVDPWDVVRAPAPKTEEPTVGAVAQSVLAALGITVPRTLPSGAPACGNVVTKGGRRVPRPC